MGGVSGSLSGWLVGGGGWGGGVMFPGPVMSLEYCKSYHLVTSTRQLGAAGFDHLKRVEPPPHTHVKLCKVRSYDHHRFFPKCKVRNFDQDVETLAVIQTSHLWTGLTHVILYVYFII